MAKGLGRGFDSLIPTDMVVDDVASPGEKIVNMDLKKLVVNPDQPRKNFDKDAIKELSASIKQHGIIQPLVVTPISDSDKYRIIAGERRYRAATMAKLGRAPVIIRNHEELEELEIALVENVQRVDLSPLEQAVSIMRLRDQFSLSLKEISTKLGKAETTISNIVRLLQLPKEAIEALQKNVISEGHARAILALKTDEEAQKELLNSIITQKLSVRSAEDFVKLKKGRSKATKKQGKLPEKIRKRVAKLKKSGFNISSISQRKKGGSVNISYADDNELEKILNKLEK